MDDDALYAAAYLHDMGGIPPYAKPGADILDFLGAIDIVRIVSLTTRERLAPDLPHAIQVIQQPDPCRPIAPAIWLPI